VFIIILNNFVITCFYLPNMLVANDPNCILKYWKNISIEFSCISSKLIDYLINENKHQFALTYQINN